MSTELPSPLSAHVLGVKYSVDLDPYQIDTREDGTIYMRYNHEDSRVWIHRVMSEGTVKTLTKTFGQWEQRDYHTYVPLHMNVKPSYFDLRNFDVYYVTKRFGDHDELVGKYVFRGDYIHYRSGTNDFVTPDDDEERRPVFYHEDFTDPDSPIYGLIIYDIDEGRWALVIGDPSDPLVAVEGITYDISSPV